MFFTNKHVVIALIIAPILAILAWFAVGQFAGEKAQLAQQGKSYPLVEKSNCRYESGHCDLQNEDFKLALTLDGLVLVVESVHALQSVMIAVGNPDQERPPVAMITAGTTGKNWRHTLAELPASGDRIRLVAATGNNAYFGDVATLFIKR
jgi:hypothetical protein